MFGLKAAFRRAAYVVGAALMFTGCAGNGNTNQDGCALVVAATPTLISPANGATGVSVAIGSLTVSGAEAGETISLLSGAGSSVTLGTITAVAANPNEETVSVPTLTASTTYTVQVRGLTAACNGGNTPTAIGSFST